MKFKCLIIDHDDTAVNSTPFIHYPAYIEAVKILRPDSKILSLEEYFIKNFEPGLITFFKNELKLNENELAIEHNIWKNFAKDRIPAFFDGFLESLSEFKNKGGIIVVASHSDVDLIKRDYKNSSDFMPDLIFGWHPDENKRKPSNYLVNEVINKFHLLKSEILIIDDLKSGLIMAKKSGIEFGFVGWSHNVPFIREYMKKESNYIFDTVKAFRNLILE